MLKSQSASWIILSSTVISSSPRHAPHWSLKHSRRAIAKIRLSAHPLAIETGRYSRETDRHDRRCQCCQLCSDDLSSLIHLPHFDPVIELEDEWHLICTCQAYNDVPQMQIAVYQNKFSQSSCREKRTQTSKPFLPTLLSYKKGPTHTERDPGRTQ